PALQAQDTAQVNPHIVTVLFENALVRVLEVISKPGDVEDWHGHPAYFAYVVRGGRLQIEAPGEETRQFDLKVGQNIALNPVERHRGTNVGQTTLRVLLVELKTGQMAGRDAPEGEAEAHRAVAKATARAFAVTR
ncbi:MAG: hypothetical protein IIA40_04015, partial [SAR324 cluster bacterium]|nr:hypothetical protein [SAR324 cluster bacterium]